ncbi:hypothetical protein AHMF7616_02156 [Adhaeribacter pallidiroseus]|uniref:Uncharacterized protein n=1 Tax=Adhaeribacter pallidiroseus TaxID=2072847 RepID=A0A369QF67_9BACT|nr:hypothetical protein AHMF7616_02156 [Adhaeribacter pallidiroseus]
MFEPAYRISDNFTFGPSLPGETSVVLTARFRAATMAAADFSLANSWPRDLPR